MGKSRRSEKRITRETEVLRSMRMARPLSLSQAGKVLGITGSAIAHIEGGRMDVLRARLEAMLKAYGFTQDQYLEFLEGRKLPIQYRDACHDLVDQLASDQLKAIYPMLKAFVITNA